MEVFDSQLLIVIVLYHKTFRETSLSEFLEKDGKSICIYIYNNGFHDAKAASSANVIYHHDESNSGVSKAYNLAATAAKKLNRKWMLILDEDTIINQDLLHAYARSVNNKSDARIFVPQLCDVKGLVSPFKFTLGRGFRISSAQAELSLENFRFINSGILIEVKTFLEVGGYDESIPLDFSDIAFGERLKQEIAAFNVVDVTLQHSFSGSEKKTVEEALHRYNFFCLGAFNFGKNYGNFVLQFINSFLRGLHLSLKYQRGIFLRRFTKVFLNG